MTLSISLSPQAEEKLRQRARAAGIEPTVYASELLENLVTKPTLEEILAPFRKRVAERKMSDEEIEKFYEELRDEAWQERQDGAR